MEKPKYIICELILNEVFEGVHMTPINMLQRECFGEAYIPKAVANRFITEIVADRTKHGMHFWNKDHHIRAISVPFDEWFEPFLGEKPASSGGLFGSKSKVNLRKGKGIFG